MPVGDHYRLTLSGNMLGQTIKNVFWYINQNTDSYASFLGTYFRDNTLLTIIAALSNTVTYTDIEVVNMDNTADFWSDAFSFSGLRSGETYDTFGAWGFLSFPTTSNYKAGGKRFPGVGETDAVNGIPTAAQLARLDNIAVVLGAVINLSGARFRPQFFSRKCVKDPVTHKCTNVFVESFGTIATYAWKWVTTQNTRKRGVGI